MRTPDGRADLRHRTTVEHALARLDQTQGKKARYKGARKNTLDARRCATVVNLQSLARLEQAA
jgi:IS5 family transposase